MPAPLTATPRMIVAKRPDILKQVISDLANHDAVHFISHGDWNLFDFFNLALVEMAPCALWLCTYAIYEYPIRQILLAQQAGQLTDVHMIIDSRSRVRNPSTLALAKNIANKIALTACHAKVMVLQKEDKAITLIGSQNWTKNPRIETGIATRDTTVATFHTDWMTKVLEGLDAFE